ncbi:MAG: hypothetical protein ACRCZ2_01285 [Fusobacteriaceae bacterium]
MFNSLFASQIEMLENILIIFKYGLILTFVLGLAHLYAKVKFILEQLSSKEMVVLNIIILMILNSLAWELGSFICIIGVATITVAYAYTVIKKR